MHSFLNSARLTGLSVLCALLAACGGGDEKAILYGTATTGTLLANATVTIRDGNGHTATVTTASNGNFAADVSAFNGPLLLTTSDPLGLSANLVSVVAATPAAGANGTANLNPLTTAIAAMLRNDGDPYAINPTNLATLATSSAIDTKVSLLNTIVANVLSFNGVSSSINPITSTFNASNTGINAVNRQLRLVSAAGGMALKESAEPGLQVTFNDLTNASTVFSRPTIAASYLDWLATELQTCLAVALVDRAANLTCTGIVDSANSYTYASLLAANTNFGLDASVGATVGVPQTIAFTTVGADKLATVRFPYTLTNGTTAIADLTVRMIAASETATVLPDLVTASWVIHSAP